MSENPYSPPVTECDQPIRELYRPGVWPRRFLVLQLVVVGLGVVAALFIDIRTITISGPALVLSGSVLAVVSWRCKDLGALMCGVSGVAFAGFLFLLVFFNEWSPNQSFTPVMGCAFFYAACVLCVAIWLQFRSRVSSPR